MDPVGVLTLDILCIFHLIVSGGWYVAVAVFQNRVSWFMSGSLVFTHVTLGALLVIRIIRVLMVRYAYRVLRFLKYSGKLDSSLRPQMWPREAGIAVLVLSVLALVGLGCYLASVIMAKYRPDSPSDPVVRTLAHALWTEELATPILVLCMLSATIGLHITDIVIASMVVFSSNTEARQEEEEQERFIDDRDASDIELMESLI
jgi:hypothetical protein